MRAIAAAALLFVAGCANAQITSVQTLPGGATSQVQYNNGWRFGGISESGVNGSSVTFKYVNATAVNVTSVVANASIVAAAIAGPSSGTVHVVATSSPALTVTATIPGTGSGDAEKVRHVLNVVLQNNTGRSAGLGVGIGLHGPAASGTTDYAAINATIETVSPDGTDLSFKVKQAGAMGEVLRITNGGKVGINTAAPSHTLDVVGSLEASSYANFGSSIATVGDAGIGGNASVAGPSFTVGTSTLVVLNGNIGMGHAAPTSRLHVYNPTNTGGLNIAQFTNTNSTLTFRSPNTSTFALQIPSSDSYFFMIGESTVASLSSSGSGALGIGTVSPGSALDVRGDGYISGNVGIGTALPDYKLHVVGDKYNSGQSIVGGTLTVQGAEFSVGGSTFVVKNGLVGVGTAAPASNLAVFANQLSGLDVVRDATTGNLASTVSRYGPFTSSGRPQFRIRQSSGTVAVPEIVASGWTAELGFDFHDGTAFRTGASLVAAVDGTPGSSDMPTRLAFATTADSASSATERLRIDSKGHFEFSGTAPTVTADCGTSPAVVGNDNVFRLYVGTGGTATSCTVKFAGTWTNEPICTANNQTAHVVTRARSSTSIVIIDAAAAFATDTYIDVQCFGRR